VIFVDGATHSQKDGVKSNGGSLKGGAEDLLLFLRGAQLVLWSSVLTVIDLDKVNVTLKNAEIFRSVLSGEGRSVGGGWRCCRSAPGLPQLSPATHKNTPPPLLVCCFFVFVVMGASRTASGRLEVNLFLPEKRDGKSHFGIILVSAVLGI
jgi:hypothetical protein